MLIWKIKNILSLLNQPYPYYYNSQRLLKISILVSIFIIFFLFVIKPFETDINELRFNYFVTCSIYSIVSGLSVYLTIQIAVFFFPRFFYEEKWTLTKELLILFILLIIIGNVNFFIRNLVNTNPDNFKIKYYLDEIAHACIVGIFPIGFFTLLNYSYLFKNQQ